MIATAAAALSDRLFGFRAQWAWTLVFGAVALGFGLAGPIGVVRTFIRRVAVWAVPLALAYLAWWALHDAHLATLWHQPGKGGLSVWQGADVVVGITVSWIPLAADYTRFSRDGRSAFWGSAVGYLLPNVGLLALGARDRALARHLRRGRASGGGRRRRRRRRARAPRPHRRRDGRRLRQRVLGGRVAAEPRAGRSAAAARHADDRDSATSAR